MCAPVRGVKNDELSRIFTKLTNFLIPKRSNKVTKAGTVQLYCVQFGAP